MCIAYQSQLFVAQHQRLLDLRHALKQAADGASHARQMQKIDVFGNLQDDRIEVQSQTLQRCVEVLCDDQLGLVVMLRKEGPLSLVYLHLQLPMFNTEPSLRSLLRL